MKKIISYTTTVASIMATLITPAFAFAGNTPAPLECNATTFDQSFVMSAKQKFQTVKLEGIHLNVPYNAAWKIMGKTIQRVEKNTSANKNEFQYYYFGKAFSSVTECNHERTYTLAIKKGKALQPSSSAISNPRIERIGKHTVFIYGIGNDTDCPGERAQLLQNGYAIEFSRTCSSMDAETRSIIASIR